MFALVDARYQLDKALLEQRDVNGAIEHLGFAARLDPKKEYIHYQLCIADADRELKLYQELKSDSRERNLPQNKGIKPNIQ